MSEPVRVDGRSLTLEEVRRVAEGGGVEPRVEDRVRRRLEEGRSAVERILASGRTAYGVNTGFGKLSDVRVGEEALASLQENLLRSHACGVGEPLTRPEARAMILLRANALAAGYSGVRPGLVEAMLELLDREVTPVVPRKGSVGASGDLAPGAHAALVLMGEGEAEVDGERVPGGEALRRAGLEPLVLGPKEGLALLNGTHAMLAVGVLALLRAEELVEAAELAGAASLEGLLGSPDAFDELVGEVRPHPGQAESARRLRGLLRESEIRESHRHGDPRVQDSYSLRCMPQVHGAARDAFRFVRQVLEVEVNSATDNPLLDPDRPEGERVLSQGNFHGQPVAQALDFLAVAVCSLAVISERRTDRLLNPDLSGLPAFLTPEPGLRSGLMMTQVTAASLVAEGRHLAHPASTGSIPTGASKEDHVSMGMQAAIEAAEAVESAERTVAVELVASAQALEFHRPLRAGEGVERGVEVVRESVPPVDEDRPLSSDIEAAARLIREGALRPVVEEAAERKG